ncbi:hypothetical protein BDF14DRAFT_1974921 [Spinellus fusiger]|nr:hypothetical protein BDF14DRAFT_1974921 [Spinellus fusiger]
MATPVDTAEQRVHYQKPDTIDSPVYHKPNAYDEDTIPTYSSIETHQETMDPVPDCHPPPPTTHRLRTSLLHHAPPTSLETVLSDTFVYSTSTTSLPEPTTTTTSNLTATTVTNSGSSTHQLLLNKLKQKTQQDMLMYDIRKRSLLKPHQHDIYQSGTKTLVYYKTQSHSYSWGFQNTLYRTQDHTTSQQLHQKGDCKMAEARRRAFQKEMTVEYGYTGTETSQPPPTLISHELSNKTNSHLLFVYETEFSTYRLRWRRPSLLSHDMVCEILLTLSTQWRTIAAFNSHGMGYFLQVGQLSVDPQALELVDPQDHPMEADLLITCCTLIDLMREVVEKAIGLGNGGVASSD